MAAKTGAREHRLSESESGKGSATGKKRMRLSGNVKEKNGAMLLGSVGSTVTLTGCPKKNASMF